MLIKEVQAIITDLEINNDVELKKANELAKEIKKGIRGVKAEYKEAKAEASKKHKEIVALEKKELEPWNNADKVLKKAIGSYMEKQKKELEVTEELFGVDIVKENKPDLGGTHVREYWEVEIVDEDKVPIKYGNVTIRDVNISKLKDIKKFEPNAEIEGVRFYKKSVVVVR